MLSSQLLYKSCARREACLAIPAQAYADCCCVRKCISRAGHAAPQPHLAWRTLNIPYVEASCREATLYQWLQGDGLHRRLPARVTAMTKAAVASNWQPRVYGFRHLPYENRQKPRGSARLAGRAGRRQLAGPGEPRDGRYLLPALNSAITPKCRHYLGNYCRQNSLHIHLPLSGLSVPPCPSPEVSTPEGMLQFMLARSL